MEEKNKEEILAKEKELREMLAQASLNALKNGIGALEKAVNALYYLKRDTPESFKEESTYGTALIEAEDKLEELGLRIKELWSP